MRFVEFENLYHIRSAGKRFQKQERGRRSTKPTCMRRSKLSCLSLFARPLAVAAHDLDLVRLHSLARILHLEGDILDQKGPDLVAETVSIEMALCSESHISPISNITPPSPIFIYLERQPRLHFLS